MAALAVALWILLHVRKTRGTGSKAGRGTLGARAAAGFVAILATLQALQSVVVLATNWPLWILALGGSAAVETCLLLYGEERRLVSPRNRLALGCLRVTLILLVVLALAQPVRVVEWSESVRRCVAVLIDDSASMQTPDTRLTGSEKIRLAEALG